MCVRIAEKGDFPIILELMNEAILNSTAIYTYEPRNLSYVETWFSKKNNFPVLVYELNGQTVAFGSYAKFREGEAYQFTVEHSIYVHRDFQGRNIAKQLLLKLIESAKKNNLHTMIGAIDAENQKSLQFHEKMGFREVGRLPKIGFKFDRWLDLVFVQLSLSPE